MWLDKELKGVSQLSAIVLLCLSSLSYSAVDTDKGKDRQFWEEWNRAIAELIRSDLEQPDPWESWNRKVFTFNDAIDRYTLTPVAKAYQWATPVVVEQGIKDMLSNLLDIETVINDLLQFKFVQAASDTGRFLLNTTVGVLGLFDVASSIGLAKHNEDFGQTLGYWGMGAGPYLIMPLFGPVTLRDGFGSFSGGYTDYLVNLDHVPTRNQLLAVRLIDKRAGLFAAEKLITGDRYAFIRDAYLQRREYLVSDGVVEDDFGDEDWSEEEWEE